LEEGNTLNGGRGGRRFVRKTDKKGGRYSLESTVRAEKRGGQTLCLRGFQAERGEGKGERGWVGRGTGGEGVGGGEGKVGR